MGILKYIYRRVNKKDKNFQGIFCGDTGSGKSLSAISFAEKLDPNFNADNIVFSASEFMEVINSGKLKKGACIVFDEAGVGIPAREWYNISNKLLNYVMQTYRHQNWIVLFTVPDFSFIDSGSRKLFHCYFETVKIDFRRKLCLIKPLFIQNNPRMGKFYFKYKYFWVNGKKQRITKLWIDLPSRELQKEYTKKKEKFTAWLNRGAQLGVRQSEIVIQKELTENQQRYFDLRNQGLNNNEASERMGIHQTSGSAIKKLIEKKGYTIKPKQYIEPSIQKPISIAPVDNI